MLLPTPSEDDIAHALEIQRIVNQMELSNPSETIKKKLRLIPGLMKYIVPFALVYIFEYFINQGTVSICFLILPQNKTNRHCLKSLLSAPAPDQKRPLGVA